MKYIIGIIISLLFNDLFGQHPIETQYSPNLVLIKIKPELKELYLSTNQIQKHKELKDLGFLRANPMFDSKFVKADHQRYQRLKSIKNHTEPFVDLNLYHYLEFSDSVNSVLIEKLKSTHYFELVERVPLIVPLYQPNDDMVDTLANTDISKELKAINAYKAWDLEKGDTNVVVAIADVGMDVTHLDLFDNVKINKNDPVDGIDNDNNGYIDDIAGWDFAMDDNNPNTDAGTGLAHGTLVAGVSSSVANNDTMLCGTGLNCRWMPLKLDIRGAILPGAGYKAILYAAMNGAKVVNLSWHHGTYYNQVYQDIINKAVNEYDIAIVASAGNNFKKWSLYPASFDNVLSATGSKEKTFWDASSHSLDVDLSAPAQMELLNNGNTTTYNSGTSFSAPMVSGALALVRSHFPQLTAVQAMERLRVSGTLLDTIPEYIPYKNLFGRRLDMYNALVSDPTSVRLKSHSIKNGNKKFMFAGDTISIDAKFLNVLKGVSNCSVKLKCDSSYIHLLDSTEYLGSFNANQTKDFNKAFSFVIDTTCPNLSIAKFVVYFEADGYTDYQTFVIDSLNMYNYNYINLDTNDINLTIVGNGRMAYVDIDATIGQGLLYKKVNQILYEGGLLLSTNEGKLSDCVRDDAYGFKKDFKSLADVKEITSSLADQHIVSHFADTNANGVKVVVTQNSFEWVKSNTMNFAVVEYKIKNVSGKKINKLNAAVFLDWDIKPLGSTNENEASNNKVIWDSTNKLAVAYNTSFKGLYVGTKILTNQSPIFAALENRFVNGYFSDTLKKELLNRGVSYTQAGNSSSSGLDISELVGVTIDSLENGKEATFALAFTVSSDVFVTINSATNAKNQYELIRKSLTPNSINVSLCNGDNYQLVLPGDKYNFYTQNVPSNSTFIKQDREISINNIERDTMFYFTNQDDVFESSVASASIKVVPIKVSGFTSIDLGNGKNLFYTTQTYSGIKWYIDNKIVADTNDYVHQFDSNGVYNVKLVLENANNCSDSIIKTIKVNSMILSLVSDIYSDDIEVRPIPTNNILTVKIPDHWQSPIYASVTNLIGVDVMDKKIITTGENDLNVSALTNGIYFVNIFASGKVYKYKFIVSS